MYLCAVLMYSSPAQRRVIRVRSPMAPQDTPGRGAMSPRHRRPPLAPGGQEGVSKHPSLINGCGFADARRGLDTYPPLTRLRRECAPFRSDERCVPAGPPMELRHPDCHPKGLRITKTRRGRRASAFKRTRSINRGCAQNARDTLFSSNNITQGIQDPCILTVSSRIALQDIEEVIVKAAKAPHTDDQ